LNGIEHIYKQRHQGRTLWRFMLRYLTGAFICLRVFSAMFRFHVVNPANIFIPAGQFPQPGTTFDFITRSRIKPGVADRMVRVRPERNETNPFKDIVTPFFSPERYVFLCQTGAIRTDNVPATISALLAPLEIATSYIGQ